MLILMISDVWFCFVFLNFHTKVKNSWYRYFSGSESFLIPACPIAASLALVCGSWKWMLGLYPINGQRHLQGWLIGKHQEAMSPRREEHHRVQKSSSMTLLFQPGSAWGIRNWVVNDDGEWKLKTDQRRCCDRVEGLLIPLTALENCLPLQSAATKQTMKLAYVLQTSLGSPLTVTSC